MKTLNSIACVGGIAVAAMLSSSLTAAGTVEQATAQDRNSGSKVHQVSHALASTSSYQGSSNAGYKWGRDHVQSESNGQWSDSNPAHSSYKWGEQNSSITDTRSYAGASSFEQNTKSSSTQTGYRWGIRSNADQTGYRWGIRSNADQTGYRWGIRSNADRTGYRWGIRSNADQTGYRWGIR